ILAINNHLRIAKRMVDRDHPIFILDNEHIDISSRIGVEVNGILGSRFFSDHRIEFDFLKKRITVFPNKTTPKSWSKVTTLAIEVIGSRPFVKISVQQDNLEINGKALIDMGNSDAVLLLKNRL